MIKALVIEERKSVAEIIERELRALSDTVSCRSISPTGAAAKIPSEPNVIIYSPSQLAAHLSAPNLEEAKKIFEQYAASPPVQFVLLSSAAAYVPQHNNTGLLSEKKQLAPGTRNSIADAWQDLETMARAFFENDAATRLSILRPAAVLASDGQDYLSRLLRRKFACVLPGYDPSMQFLDPEDLAQAVRLVVERQAAGVFNVAPDGVVSLRAALRKSKAGRLPIARSLQRAARGVLKPLKNIEPIEQLDFIRYSWTVSNEKSKRELGFQPQYSSAETVRRFSGENTNPAAAAEEFDEFGMDKSYISLFGRTWFKFMHDFYWRVEVAGMPQIPAQGRGVLVGVHRGFMPWDAVMMLHEVVKTHGRYPRFLIHPGLIKYPFLFNFHTKLGGVVACQENADYILGRDELLGVFPEGMRGAFSLYKDAYKVGRFWRDDFVRMALRNRAPIIPYVTVGSAEIFPILAKIDWKWWKRRTEWVYFPITPTFPFLPFPLPSKWHTQILPPIHVEEMYEPEAANDRQIVRAISREVRGQMESALNALRARRKSIFFGSIFKENEAPVEPVYKGALSLRDEVELEPKILRRN